jgi:hypothetical protein
MHFMPPQHIIPSPHMCSSKADNFSRTPTGCLKLLSGRHVTHAHMIMHLKRVPGSFSTIHSSAAGAMVMTREQNSLLQTPEARVFPWLLSHATFQFHGEKQRLQWARVSSMRQARRLAWIAPSASLYSRLLCRLMTIIVLSFSP